MDMVSEDAKSLSRELGVGDREKLDAYFTGVRDLEKRMAEAEKWAELPKPQVHQSIPVTSMTPVILLVAKEQCVMSSNLLCKPIQHVSFRFIYRCKWLNPHCRSRRQHHSLSHHGRDSEKLEQLALVEAAVMKQWGNFLQGARS